MFFPLSSIECLFQSCRSDVEQNLSAEWSSLVNKAYKVLQSPLQRAEYLLNQQNITIPEGNTAIGNEFLMEMMERNEEACRRTCIQFIGSQEIFYIKFAFDSRLTRPTRKKNWWNCCTKFATNAPNARKNWRNHYWPMNWRQPKH